MPRDVRAAIERRAEAAGFAPLRRAAEALSESYRARGGTPPGLPAEVRVAAYLAVRMPATYAAAHAVLREVRARLGGESVASVLDVGAGTGAASLAAREWFPDARITMVERDAALAEAAREWLPGAAYVAGDVARMDRFPEHDLVIAAYSLGEMAPAPLAALWQSARAAFVAVEPGTPRGFALIRDVRGRLLTAGAHMLAPCPVETPCPMRDSDWCHFAARVERSALHRRLKGADLSYEDEKFSYVALAREAAPMAPARIIRRPAQKPGLILLETCAPEGITPLNVTKRDREAFRAARAARWGDAWEPPATLS